MEERIEKIKSLMAWQDIRIIGGPYAGRVGTISGPWALEVLGTPMDFVKMQVFLHGDAINHAEFIIEDVENIEIREA